MARPLREEGGGGGKALEAGPLKKDFNFCCGFPNKTVKKSLYTHYKTIAKPLHKQYQNITNLQYTYIEKDPISGLKASRYVQCISCMSKKYWPNLYGNLLYQMGQDFLDRRCMAGQPYK